MKYQSERYEDKSNKKLLLLKATTFQDPRISSQAKGIYVIRRDGYDVEKGQKTKKSIS